MEKHMFEELSFRKVFKFILALLLFSCGASGYAGVLDNRVVKGVVKDETGEPLPAVTVVVKGTTKIWPGLNFLAASVALRHTQTSPLALWLPMPTPASRESPTMWTLIMLVVPEMPTGTPAVTTTRSPSCTRPALLAFATDILMSSSVEVA